MVTAFRFLVFLSLYRLPLDARATTPTESLNKDRLECSFAIKQFEFDLCPLIEAHSERFDIAIDEETPPTCTKKVYAVSLGGALKTDGTLPAELQCPEGTRICLTVVNTRPDHPSEPSRVLQVIPVAGADLDPRAVLGDKVSEHAPLQLTLHGGLYMQQKQRATFIFHCDQDAEEPTAPTFSWDFNGTHAFSWKTKHACHKVLATPQPDPEADPDPPQDRPKEPEDSDPGKNANAPPPRSWFNGFFSVLWVLLMSVSRFVLRGRLSDAHDRILFCVRLVNVLLPRQYRYHWLSTPLLPTAITRQLQLLPRSLLVFVRKARNGHRAPEAAYQTTFVDIEPHFDGGEGEDVPLTPTPTGTFRRGKSYANMNKIMKTLILSSLLGLLGISSAAPPNLLEPYPGKPRITFRPDGSFKLTVFSDLHFGENPWEDWGPEQDRKSVILMDRVLKDEKPDYVVLNGDLITGENTFRENSTTLIDQIVGPLNQAKVPFSSAHGNHDNQANITHAEEILHAAPALVLWFFDSRGGFSAGPASTRLPDWVDASVGEWIKSETCAMEAAWGPATNRGALAFVHIPPHVSTTLQRKLDSKKNPGLNADSLEGQGSVQATTNAADYGKDNAFWDSVTTNIKNLHAVISGHDHGDEWCARDRIKNVIFCFNKHSGYGGYSSSGWGHGVRNLVFKSPDPTVAVETWIRLEEGETRARITLNSLYN
ncbi:hypothetical protein H0H81_004078 [Sphagnurus paluster]|uniref:Calcineurin-like phosphoesterase domain-containing protein n=1 Tax=Sphagnurus paluster TaxID=117069 RepID=A0A9P7KJI7_9AGAR|nr:hypothetical protein H0H81_004078 [Sphagnurus paluster]